MSKLEARYPVTFAPSGVTAWVPSDSTILDAARIAGVVIAAPCGGRGICGKCAVRLVEGHLQPPDEFERVGLAKAPPGVRLACRAGVDRPVTVRPIVGGQAARASVSGESVTDDAFYAGVDLGTTTVSAVIVGSITGLELGRAGVVNRQQTLGMDVIARLGAALDGHDEELRRSAEGSIQDALSAACGAAGACLERIERVVVSGNTAMIALLEGVDASPLARAPFEVPPDLGSTIEVPELGERLSPGAQVVAVAGLGGFVGGDVSAGLLAAGLLSDDADSVYIDIGTNAEIVVRRKRRLYYASAAAGPAFEGYGIASGGVHGPGAITSVSVDGDIAFDVVGGGEPNYFAGSGVISAIAALVRAGHIDGEGLLGAAGPLQDRFGRGDDGVARVGFGEGGGQPYLTQLDVRAFQTAKAAVAAGMFTLARRARLKAKRVERMVVSGSFGTALDVTELVALGVVPADLESCTESLPGGALTGAAAIAFDPSVVGDLEREKATATRVELATDSDFPETFVRATRLAPFTLKKGF